MRHTVNMGLPTMMFYPSLITPLCFRVVALNNKRVELPISRFALIL